MKPRLATPSKKGTRPAPQSQAPQCLSPPPWDTRGACSNTHSEMER
ncbi:hypothetical protein E2C01_085075 [Portunus trituberculatus]|uniref:Uncharacterized protein n=1 Tax=Portunus trituberculatus TaxID=210409 RepID=A0A5B7J9H3_PORTR|nr:hypothetical protein [Portunus trituberculatus]